MANINLQNFYTARNEVLDIQVHYDIARPNHLQFWGDTETFSAIQQ